MDGRSASSRRSYFDTKMGLAGAAVMGAVVYYINNEYGICPATIAAGKQAAYTFLVGGTIMKACENISTGIRNGKLARTASFLVPSIATVSLTYLLHKVKGTPEPLNSTIPTILIAPPSFAVWGNLKRNQLERRVDS